MKRFWIMVLAVALALVIALPAGAGKPDKPDKPPKPSASAPVAVSLEGSPMWVHEAGDDIWYSVTVENKSGAEVTVDIVYPEGAAPYQITVPAKSAETVEDLFKREVTPKDIGNCLDDETCDLFAEVTVQYPNDDVIAVVETSTLVDPVDQCIFEDEYGDPVVTKSGLCIWKPSSLGTWELSAVPDPIPTRPTRAMMTMRDGVPGNWCTLTDDPDFPDNGGIVQDRLKGSEPIVLDVYLPDDGECLLGGHGVCTEDDCYFAVGNPESFYLYTTFDGTITLTKH